MQVINTIVNMLTHKTVLNYTQDLSIIEVPNDFDLSDFARNLNRSIMMLYGDFLSVDGDYVDYVGLKDSQDFQEIVDSTVLLNVVDLGNLKEQEKKPFYINLYNIAMIHSYAVYGTPNGWFDRFSLFSRTGYRIGEYFFTLNDIEHGLLRGNVKNPTTGKRQWKKSDPRNVFKCDLDPRIHFALVCGAKSCPPIRVYTPGNCENALNFATRVFCNANVEIVSEKNEIWLSMIMKWYRKDFGTKVELLDFIQEHLDEELKDIFVKAREAGATVKHFEYDWSVNGDI
eukprot:TRINITY_DN9343_c0_g1_i1.p1 TRINITY_DN9343_c0_g1~~TRINITY_DN9343_c0_g1_i1.p1  ORF type:complete len:285 (+),score=54.02 TRINITY_DN9343_c0_g1_i1:47-901(+)